MDLDANANEGARRRDIPASMTFSSGIGPRRREARPTRPVRPAIHQLDTFLRVVETRSFTDVADQLGVSPSAVSQSIARLEDIHGGELLIRNRRAPLGLTPMGKEILPGARAIVDIVDRQMARATAAATSRVGTLCIGFHPGIASGPLREGLADFLAACPGIELQFIEGSPATLYRRLNDHAIDVMITGLLPAMTTPTVVRELLWRERLFAILPENHPVARKQLLRPVDIAALSIILSSRQHELAGFRAILQPVANMQFDCQEFDVSRSALFELVALNLGVTISPESACIDRPGIVRRPIGGAKCRLTIEAIWLAHDANPIRHRFVRHLRERAPSCASQR